MLRAFLRQTAALSLSVFVMSIGGRAMASSAACAHVNEARGQSARPQLGHSFTAPCADISASWPKDIGFGCVEEREAEERLTDPMAQHAEMAVGGTDPRVTNVAACSSVLACAPHLFGSTAARYLRLRVLRL